MQWFQSRAIHTCVSHIAIFTGGFVQTNECRLSCHDLQRVECEKQNCSTVTITQNDTCVHASECNGKHLMH